MKKESSAAIVFRILFTIAMVFTILVGSTVLVYRTTVFNVKAWTKEIKKENFKEMLVEGLLDEFEGEEIDEMEDYGIDKEEFMNATIDFAFEDLFELFGDEDYEPDEDAFDDYFEYYEDAYDEMGLSREQIREKHDEMWDEWVELMDDTRSDLDEFYEFADSAGNVVNVTLIVCVVLTAVMMVILVIIHHNKALPFRNLGISTVIAGGLNLAGSGLFSAMLISIISEGPSSDFEDTMIEIVRDMLLKPVFGFAALVVVGILLIVVSVAVSKNITSTDAEYDE